MPKIKQAVSWKSNFDFDREMRCQYSPFNHRHEYSEFKKKLVMFQISLHTSYPPYARDYLSRDLSRFFNVYSRDRAISCIFDLNYRDYDQYFDVSNKTDSEGNLTLLTHPYFLKRIKDNSTQMRIDIGGGSAGLINPILIGCLCPDDNGPTFDYRNPMSPIRDPSTDGRLHLYFYILCDEVGLNSHYSSTNIKLLVKQTMQSNLDAWYVPGKIVGLTSKDHVKPKVSDSEKLAQIQLRDVLTEREFFKYLKTGKLVVKGKSGKRYVLFNDNNSKVRVLQKNVFTHEICIHTDAKCPPTDHIINLKTLIEFDEEGFWKLGNVNTTSNSVLKSRIENTLKAGTRIFSSVLKTYSETKAAKEKFEKESSILQVNAEVPPIHKLDYFLRQLNTQSPDFRRQRLLDRDRDAYAMRNPGYFEYNREQEEAFARHRYEYFNQPVIANATLQHATIE